MTRHRSFRKLPEDEAKVDNLNFSEKPKGDLSPPSPNDKSTVVRIAENFLDTQSAQVWKPPTKSVHNNATVPIDLREYCVTAAKKTSNSQSKDMLQCRDDPPLFNLQDNATIEFFLRLQAFSEIYTRIHQYVCLTVCIFGITLNVLHIFVLSRRTMRTYIINALLCAMAVCDTITMSSYLVYILRFRIFDNTTGVVGYSYPWLVFLIGHVTSSIALHTCSLYLSVTMAYIRWTALDRLDAKWINHGAIRRIFFFTMFFVTFISIPTLMVHKITPVNEVLGINDTQYDNLYTVQLDEIDINGCTLFRTNLWLTGIFFKAVPCVLLLWFTIALIWKLCEMSKKRKRLRANNKYSRNCSKVNIDKTTLMLIIMLLVFLCTELPQGLIAILSAIYPTHIHAMIYLNVGEVLDLMSLVNCLTSFVLYCCMSSTYRANVRLLFFPNHKTTTQKTTLALQSLKLLMS
ncbi:Serpentine type 7TM GPCR chemoreceptor Srw [Parelaphostrongylus tenuis]|uniref:Serpentine type 7TM GPCR chemoreceptor Srw n=1 Tax=Parelaphostrongylus tenuis TaxID=148309 RepID=A0AAD5RHC2_PARTN|nr:Serpentine type 7TM GPCR chemoreceptor Srw [Parelaphostrongylus tenuis]